MAADIVPRMEKVPPHNHDGVGGLHMYVPWWKFDRKNDFPRGYHIELWGGRDMPGVGMFHDSCDDGEGYGAELEATPAQGVRNLSRLLGARGDDPESRQLLRNRSHPG